MARKILIVEDNPQDQKIMKRILSKASLGDITIAGSGEEGVQKAKSEKPDLIVLDTVLPGMDGFSTCRELRKAKETKQAKIIITTGAIDAVDAGKAKSAGADDYVVKSSDFSYLVKAVQSIFG